MDAAILAVGTELLGSRRLDTNSLRMAHILRVYGVDLKAKSVAGDDEGEIARQLLFLMDRARLVLITGGLGPTADDVTREGVARAFDRELDFDEDILSDIARRFRAFGMAMPEANRKQAYVIRGAEVLENENGSAPGLRIDNGGNTVFLFPGVPSELEAMIPLYLEPWLAANTEGAKTESRVLRVSCVSESSVEDQITSVYDEFGRESLTLLASPGEIAVELTATGDDAERRKLLDGMSRRIRELLGPTIFSTGEFENLEEAVGSLLEKRGLTLTVAESCTGGLLAQRITSVAGSSAYFLGGAISYSNSLKEELLGVDPATLETCGAVSEEVARAMAGGARRRFGADLAIGITGIAGPEGGAEDKPVGTVHIALATPDAIRHRQFRFLGDRERVRRMSSQWALEMIRRELGRPNRDAE